MKVLEVLRIFILGAIIGIVLGLVEQHFEVLSGAIEMLAVLVGCSLGLKAIIICERNNANK
jgi:uncharacterized membrane protein YoaK (UPF0700 family)